MTLLTCSARVELFAIFSSFVFPHPKADEGARGYSGSPWPATAPGTLGVLGPTRICVGKSLIFPIALFLLPKFDAGKPGGESVSALLFSVSVLLYSSALP